MSTNAKIAQSLADNNVIIHQQLSYLADIPIGESRSALEAYYKTKPQDIYPIYIVSGSRFVHGQLSYVFLITRPSQLEKTKAKFQTVVAVQFYGLAQGSEEPTSTQLQTLLSYAQELLQQTEIALLTQQPVLAANPLRNNAYGAICNDTILRAENAFSKSLKSFSTPTPQNAIPSPFDDENKTSPSSAVAGTKQTNKPNTIQQKQQSTLMLFAPTPTSSSSTKNTKPATSAFDDFDDDDDFGSNRVVKRAPSSSLSRNSSTTVNTLTTTTTSATSSKTAVKRQSSVPATSLFDEVHEVPSAPSKTAQHKGIFASSSNNSSTTSAGTGEGDVPLNTKPTTNLFDEFDDGDLMVLTKSKSKPTKAASSNASGSGSGPKKGPGKKAAVVLESENSDESDGPDPFDFSYTNHSQEALMGDNSGDDSDDAMVKAAKGKKVEVKGTAEEVQGKKRVVLESESESDDEESYSRTVMKANAVSGERRESNWKQLSKEEWEEVKKKEKEEEEEVKREKERLKQEKIDRENAARQQALTSGATSGPQTRVDAETGKRQVLTKVSKMVTRVDEDGYEVRERAYVDEWQNEVAKAVKTPAPKAKVAPVANAAKITAPSPAAGSAASKQTAGKKETPKNGGIMSFLNKK